MAFDIYGSTLRAGHCEVHPHVHEDYPCTLCYLEKERHEMQREQEPIDNRVHPDDPLRSYPHLSNALEYVGCYGAGHGLKGMEQWGTIVTWCRDAAQALENLVAACPSGLNSQLHQPLIMAISAAACVIERAKGKTS